MNATKKVEGVDLAMDAVPQALPLVRPVESRPSPFRAEDDFKFEHPGLPFPKVYDMRGFILTLAKGKIQRPLPEHESAQVEILIPPKVQHDRVSIILYEATLALTPLEIPPRRPFIVRVWLAKGIAEKGWQLRLALKGMMFREVL